MDDALSEGAFRFVSIQNPEEAHGAGFQRSVRLHAVTQALQKKRRKEQSPSLNFHSTDNNTDRPNQT